MIVSSFKRNNGPRTGSKGGGFRAKMHIKYLLKVLKTFLHNLWSRVVRSRAVYILIMMAICLLLNVEISILGYTLLLITLSVQKNTFKHINRNKSKINNNSPASEPLKVSEQLKLVEKCASAFICVIREHNLLFLLGALVCTPPDLSSQITLMDRPVQRGEVKDIVMFVNWKETNIRWFSTCFCLIVHLNHLKCFQFSTCDWRYCVTYNSTATTNLVNIVHSTTNLVNIVHST